MFFIYIFSKCTFEQFYNVINYKSNLSFYLRVPTIKIHEMSVYGTVLMGVSKYLFRIHDIFWIKWSWGSRKLENLAINWNWPVKIFPGHHSWTTPQNAKNKKMKILFWIISFYTEHWYKSDMKNAKNELFCNANTNDIRAIFPAGFQKDTTENIWCKLPWI